MSAGLLGSLLEQDSRQDEETGPRREKVGHLWRSEKAVH